MKDYPTEKIRNVCLAGQRGSGKTSLADAVAFTCGVNNRIGRVDDGSSLFDYTDAEINHRTSISSKLLACECKGIKLNLFDCPGHADFIGELLAALKVSDAVGIVIDATAGVEIGTQLQWRAIEKSNVARFFFVNKMAKEHASLQKNLDSITNSFGKQAVAVELPIGEAATFKGIVDLLHQKAYTFDDKGGRIEIPIPDNMKDQVQNERAKLIEVAAEADDSLIEKYFADGTLNDADIQKGILSGLINKSLYPVLFGSAEKNVGIQTMLEFIAEYLPSPKDMPPVKVLKTGTTTEMSIPCDPNGKTVAFIFKTMSEGHLGDMSFYRVFSGTVKQGADVVNQVNSSFERVAHTYTFQGKNRIDTHGTPAGDIGVLVKLKSTHTGNTLADKDFGVTIPQIAYPTPVMDVAVKPKHKGDEEKVAAGLHKLHEEDPTFKIVQDGALHQQVLYAQGSTHIEILMEKLRKRFGVEIETAKPKIPYRETIKGKADKQHKHKKQSGGRGQYGDVYLRLEPNARGAGFEFVDAITGGVIPGKYVPAVEKGVLEALQNGSLAGAPIVDVKATLYFGSYHDVDSSDMAFKIAGMMAFREGFLEAKPVILEPIYSIEVTVPDTYTGDVMGDLSSRRGKIAGMEPEGHSQKIKALVPQGELYQYSVDLRSMTQGQGVYATSFSHYEEVPHETAQKIIDAHKAERNGDTGH
ncbi:MAG: elongation factor G [candidate division Zixibacteria bacterium]|nr:elongation factor G [candidate division Zixibacteria bacterium]